jgi:DNA-binding CsgD family transcriptional regulator
MDKQHNNPISNRDLVYLLDLVSSSLTCSEHEDLCDFVKKIQYLVPFDFATCVLAGVENGQVKEAYHHLNINFPEEWSNIYARRKYHTLDPIFRNHFQYFLMQYWEDTYKQNNSLPKSFLSMSKDFGLGKGYTYGSVNAKKKEASLISIAGGPINRDLRTEFILQRISPFLHLILKKVTKKTGQEYLALSRREREILKWLSQGKTAWETSIILGISQRTVKFFISSILEKMDAVNTVQAVAIAIDSGIVELD